MLFFATTLVAQQLAETIEVRVANIDVVVTDKSGQPVHGLTGDDFLLYENGKLRPVTNFSEISGESPNSNAAGSAIAQQDVQIPPRHLIVFIDNSSIEPFRRNQVIDSITKTLSKLMRPSDEAMVVTWNHRFETVLRFTSDYATIKRSLDEARSYSSGASSLPVQKANVMNEARAMLAAARTGRMRMADAYSASIGAARAFAGFMRQSEVLLLRAMTQTISMLSGVEGRKVLIFVGGELEERPGLDVFQLVDGLFESQSRNNMPAVVREADLNTTDEILKLARNANANGITLYMLDALDRARDATSGSMESLPNAEVEFTNESNSYFSMVRLASNTGGTVLSGSRNFALALDNIARDLGSYYSIGYKPSEGGGADRSISVKVKREGLVVRARRSYSLRNTDDQTSDRVVANAFHSPMKGDFPVLIAADKPEPFEQGLFKVKLTITFPSALTYLPDGQDLAGEYAVYFVTASAEGALSKVGKQVQPVKFPAAALAQVRQRPFTHSTALVVRRGTQTISVAVFDKYGARTGYAATTIDAR